MPEDRGRCIEWRLIRDLREWGECDLNDPVPAPWLLHDEITASFLPFHTFAEKLERHWA